MCGAPGGAYDEAAGLALRARLGIDAEDAEAGGGSGFSGSCGRRQCVEQLTTLLDQGLSDAVAEDAVAADADEAVWQDVAQEAAAESRRVELGGLDAIAVFAVAIAEGDGVPVVADETAVGDGDPARVTSEVLDDLLGSCEWPAQVDVPGS